MTLGCWVDLLTWNVTESEINAQEVESLLELGVLKLGNREPVCSPKRDSGLKIVPHFLSKKDCKCQSCLVTDYPSLVLDAICNRVLVLIGNDGHLEAHQVIGIGLRVVEFVNEKEATARTLSTAVSYSVARFYYVVASANALWQKHEEAIRYATVAARALDSAPVKNAGLSISIRRLVLGVRWTQSYKRPIKPKPISRRFASGASITTAVTPEGMPTVKSATRLLNHNPKHAEKGYFDVAESGKLARKSLYSREGNKVGCGIEELDGISELSVSPAPAFAKKIVKPPKTYGTNLRVPNAANMEPKKESCEISNALETGVSDVPIFAGKLERPSETQAKKAKTNMLFKAIINQLHADGSETPERTDDGSTKNVPHTPPNPVMVEASSARKPRTEIKPKGPKANILGTPCMASLAKIGIGAKTPAIKVYYDPDGLESTAKKQKSRSTVKKSKRLATKGSACDKLGTPKATRTRAAKEKITMDEDSSDEIELVSAQFKRLLAQKERSYDEGTFKKPAIAGKSAHVEGEKASTQISEYPPKFDVDVNKDDTGSTDSFHSTLTHFDDTFDSLPPMKKPLASYSKKGLASEANPTPNNKDDSESNGSYFSLCSDETLGSGPPMKKPVICSSKKELPVEEKSAKLNGVMAADEKANLGPRLVSQTCEGFEAADDFDSSRVVAAPFRKVLTKMTARPVFEETILDVTNEESGQLESDAAAGKHVAEKSPDHKPFKSCSPRRAIIEGSEDEPEFSEVIAQTKTRKARRAIFDDTADTRATELSSGYAATSEKQLVGNLADPKPSTSRNLRRAVIDQPVEAGYSSECSRVFAVPTRTLKARRAIFDDTADIRDSECLPETASVGGKHAAGKVADPKPSKSRNPRRAVVEEHQDIESGKLEPLAAVATPLKTQKPRRAVFEGTIDVGEAESQSSEEVVSPFRKIIGHSAYRNSQLFDETTVDLTNETVPSEIATIAVHGKGKRIEEAKSTSQKAKDTTLAVVKNTADESDVDSTVVAAPFRKLAKSGQSGVVSRVKPIIHDETLDQEGIEEGERVGKCKEVVSITVKPSPISKTKKSNLNETFDKEEKLEEGQNSETTNGAAQEKAAVKGVCIEPANRSKARVAKLVVPGIVEVDKLGGKKTAANAKKSDSNLEAFAKKIPAKVDSKSAISSTRRVRGAELQKYPSATSRAAKGTSVAVAAGSSKAGEKPARGARTVRKEPKPSVLKQPAETEKSAKGVMLKAPSSAITAGLPDGENSHPSSGAASPSLVHEAAEATSKAAAAGSSKAASLTTIPKAPAAGSSKAASLTTSPKAVGSAAARPKRGARAAPKEPQPGGVKQSAKTAIAAESLKVPAPNLLLKSPDHENVDPHCTTASPSLIDSSVIESSFVELPTEMKLPLAPRYLAEEMNKLSISSKPAKQHGETNPVRETRRNIRK